MSHDGQQRLSIIIPCCNEEDAVTLLPERLFPIVGQLSLRYATELLLVDDGSDDRTWLRLTELQSRPHPGELRLLRHDTNLGLGAALRTGTRAATGDIIVTLDCDGTYPFAIVTELVGAIEAGADVATASPYHRLGSVEGVSALRLVFSRSASLLYRLLVDRRIRTWTAMVRAYRAEVLLAAIPNTEGFLHVAATLVECRRRGAEIHEIPAVLATRRIGQSKAKVLRITRAHARYMARLVALRVSGRLWLAPAPVKATAS